MSARRTDVEELKRAAEAGRLAGIKLRELEQQEERRQNTKMIGKCFRYRNCYSCPKTEADYWWLYAKVTGVDDEGYMLALTFQTDCRGDISIEPRKLMMSKLLDGYRPISNHAFEAEWLNLKDKIARLA